MNSSMSMSFYFKTNITNFLFYNWNGSQLGEFIIICCVAGVMVILLEAVKALRAYICRQLHANPITYAMTQENLAGRSPLLRPLVIPSSVQDIKCRKLRLHLADTVVHVLHIVLGYFIMLSVMTFNGWIGIAVVIGAALGFFIFGAIRFVYFESKEQKLVQKPQTEEQTTESREPLFDSRELDASMQSIGEGTRTHVEIHR